MNEQTEQTVIDWKERAEKAEARIEELQIALDTSAQVTAKQIAKSAADLQRAEKAEAIINGMFPMWIAAMSYCEHGRASDLYRMRNYYNGRNNPMTSDGLKLLFSLTDNNKQDGKKPDFDLSIGRTQMGYNYDDRT